MTCAEARALRLRWMAGEVPEGDARARLAAHAAGCALCGATLGAHDEADLASPPFLAGAARAAEPAPGFAGRVLARLPRASTGRLVPPPPAPGARMRAVLGADAARRQRYLRLWGTAAAATLLLSTGAWAGGVWLRSKVRLAEVVASAGSPQGAATPWGRYQPLRVGDGLPPGARLRTDGSALIRLRLPDGSLVDLGPSSRLVLKGPREGRLEAGRIWVSASKGEAPWTVRTALGTVRTLGTVFSVALEPEKPATEGGATATPLERRSP